MSGKNRFYLYAINEETKAEVIIGYCETFKDSLIEALKFYEDNDISVFDVRCFDQQAKPNMYCYWSLRRAPRCATLYRRPKNSETFTHEDLLAYFQEGEVAVL